jgi:hypothetical protein
MRSSITRALFLVGFALLLGGCATYSTQMERGRSLAKVQRFFVVSNLNDNHGLNHRIVEALRDAGREAETGPLTMMPGKTEIVVAYQDHWSWDFAEHLDHFQITVRDTRSEQSFGTVTFSARVPLREEPTVTVRRLVTKLLEK